MAMQEAVSSRVVVVTGPARGLVGGQSRHLELLDDVAARLGCRLARVEIGRRMNERGLAGLAARMLRDYCAFARAVKSARSTGAAVVVHINSSVQYASLFRDLGFSLIARSMQCGEHLVQIHGCQLTSARERRPLLRAMGRMMARLADRFVVLSVSQAEAIGGPARRSLVIPNATRLLESVVRCRDDGKSLAVLYLARMVPEKGVLLCLEALRLLRNEGVGVRLTLVGDGPLLAGLPERIQALDLVADVTLLGAVAAGEVRTLLTRHDLLWAPSRYAEGQPYALIEALEAGLPALATVATPAMRDMIGLSDGGLIEVAPDPHALAAATKRLASDRDEVERLQKVARKAAERNFSLEATLPLWHVAWAVDGSPTAGLDPVPA